MQTNIIDCMELRSAEIRSHIVIRRASRVYSLCVFRLLQRRNPGRDRMMCTSSPPSSFTVAPCTKSIPITCCIQILVTCCIRILVTCCIRILVTCLFESSSYVIFESIINHIHKKSAMTVIRHNILSAYQCRITSPGIPDSTVKSSKDI